MTMANANKGDGDTNSIPSLESYKYHAFVTHATDDQDFAEDLVGKLESAGFRILYASRDFLPGCRIVDEMDHAVRDARRTILIVSENFLRSDFCNYEAVLATERSIRERKVAHIPIIYNMKTEDIPDRYKWINYLNYEDKAYFWDRLFKALSDPDIHMEAAMPVLHVAQGLAWSYYYGYLNFLLAGHSGRVERSKWWDPEPEKRRMSRKLFLLIPESCYCYPTFGKADSAISSAGHLEKFTHTRAGNQSRDYTTPVHQLTDPDGEVYYFVGEYATPILSMYEMADGKLAGLTEEDKSRQVVSFYHTLHNILCHADAKHCHGKFHIFMYKDKTEDGSRFPLSAELSKLIKEEIKKEIAWDLMKQMGDTKI